MEGWWAKGNWNFHHTFVFNQPIDLKEKLEHLEELYLFALKFCNSLSSHIFYKCNSLTTRWTRKGKNMLFHDESFIMTCLVL